MKRHYVRYVGVALILAGALLLVAAQPHVYERISSAVMVRPADVVPANREAEAEAHLQRVSLALQGVLLVYGIGLALAGTAFVHRAGKMSAERGMAGAGLSDGIVEFGTGLVQSARKLVHCPVDATALVAVLGFGACLRAYFMSQPMRYDEAFTFITFVDRSPAFLFYYMTNNHVFHSILVKCVTLVFGGSPVAIRLVGFLAGVALAGATWFLARSLAGGRCGVFAALAICVSPYMVLYSTMARGYSLVALVLVVLALAAQGFARKPSVGGSLVVALIASLGLLTMPSFLYAVGGIYLWILLLLIAKKMSFRDVLRVFVLPASILTAMVSFFLYTPVIVASGGVAPIIANDLVRPLPFRTFLLRIPDHLVEVLAVFSRDIPVPVLALLALLVLCGFAAAWKQANHELALFLPAMLVGSAAVFLFKRSIPFDRNWIYFLPVVAVYVDVGIVSLAGKCPEWLRRCVVAVVVLAAAGFSLHVASGNVVARYPDTGLFPEASLLTRTILPGIEKDDAFVAKAPVNYPVRFYLRYYGLSKSTWKYKPQTRTIYYVVKKSEHSIRDLVDEPVQKVAEICDGVVYARDVGDKADLAAPAP